MAFFYSEEQLRMDTWTKRFCNASLDENFLIKESTAEALLSGHTNANENVKIQSLHES